MKVNIIGQVFNRLEVVEYHGRNKFRESVWTCKCTCGNTVVASTNSLRSGNTKSCGCFQKEKASENGAKSATTHGLSRSNKKKTRLFRIWSGIKSRCFNTNVREYKSYGGCGITICNEWLQFEIFHKWAFENGYSDILTIERKDVNDDYCPSNCYWIPLSDQSKNRTTSKFLTVDGETKIMADFAKQYGISSATIYGRLKSGWSETRAVKTKVNTVQL